MNTIKIKWATGEMEIILDTFFPTTKARMKKLSDIIRLDSRYYRIMKELEFYFEKLILNEENFIGKPKSYRQRIQRNLNYISLQIVKENISHVENYKQPNH